MKKRQRIENNKDENNQGAIIANIQLVEEKQQILSKPLNTIELSPIMMEQYGITENQNVLLIKGSTGEKKVFCARKSKRLSNRQINISEVNKKIFKPQEKMWIQLIEHLSFEKVWVQKIDNVQNKVITLPETYKTQIEQYGTAYFEVINHVTGASIDVAKHQIEYDAIEEGSCIRLNYFQRLILEVDAPKVISPYYFDQFKNIHSSEVLEKYYAEGKALNKETLNQVENSYELKQAIKRELQRSGYPKISLYPIYNCSKIKEKWHKRIIDKILEVIIGSNEIELKCIRPYITDESCNVVRISQSNLELLGVHETDNLVITYRGKREKVRVLAINEVESIKETNIFQSDSEINACIGIPAYIRSKLGMNKIDVCCKVKRDKIYLFKKNLNIQFISIVATILTIKQTFQDDRFVLGGLILMTPVSIYVIFSEVRNRIKNT